MPHDYMMEDEDTSAPPMERKASTKETALLPKSFFPESKNVEPGKVCKIRVERVLEDEVEVSYVRHDKDEDDEDETEVPVEEDDDEAYA